MQIGVQETEWARHGRPAGMAEKTERPCELHEWAGALLSHRVAAPRRLPGDQVAPEESVNGEVRWAVGAPDEEFVFEEDWGVNA